ncbi:phosphatidylinositol binding clathrin assembly [Echinococcus multilocularis]|uniref:Phosphatidylinositol binding clathrin assembly n=2 Tax=Echinococcus multilocularis TaxID=6211 RepID=A0A068YFF8_ECHMU|nr:phosphatidylinositol binding clathrin assembly [Echinococcus multilocularis]
MASRTGKRLTGNSRGQSFADRMNSVKHSIAGSLIAKTICKATTEEMISPKRKHLNILVSCTYEPRLSMPEFSNYIIGRSHNSSWVVSFKALITIHHLMNAGSERFSQYLASNNCQLSSPRSFERSSSQAATMFLFIRHYARYLDARSASYCEVAFDFCKIRRKADDVNMKTMAYAKLVRVLPPLERQIDALLAFDASSSELSNGVVLAAYVLLYKDLIRLYAVYNEAMINIIEKFFSMSKRDCQESLHIYKAFLKRMEHVNHFIKVAEACELLQLQDGFGKQSLIFKPVPSSVLNALEGHLAHLEGKKFNDLSKTSPSVSSPPITAAVTGDLVQLQGVSNQQNLSVEQQRIIEEERQRLEAFVSEARAKCPNMTPEHASCGIDLLQFSIDAVGGGGASKAATSYTFFDDFFFEPVLPASSSHMALSTATMAQPRPLSQFLSEPSSVSAVDNSHNLFLPSSSAVWPTTTTSGGNMLALKPPTSTLTTATSDLDSHLAEIASQLAVCNTNTTAVGGTVNWTGLGKPQQQQQHQQQQLAGVGMEPMPASAMNPWATPRGVLQPTPVNNPSLTNQTFNSMPRAPLQTIQRHQVPYALTQYPAGGMNSQVSAFSPRPINVPPNWSALQLQLQQPQLQQSLQFQSATSAATAFNSLNPFL